MGNMNFMDMTDTYDDRKVACWPDGDDWIVDTCAVTDADQPFETAVKHPEYNGGDMVIVEEYAGRDLAEVGHEKWVGLMSAKELPAGLADASTSGAGQLAKAFSDEGDYQYPRKRLSGDTVGEADTKTE